MDEPFKSKVSALKHARSLSSEEHLCLEARASMPFLIGSIQNNKKTNTLVRRGAATSFLDLEPVLRPTKTQVRGS